VSTRKVDRLVEQLGIDGMTKDRVSALCRALDESRLGRAAQLAVVCDQCQDARCWGEAKAALRPVCDRGQRNSPLVATYSPPVRPGS
jgi:hypothetical protein